MKELLKLSLSRCILGLACHWARGFTAFARSADQAPSNATGAVGSGAPKRLVRRASCTERNANTVWARAFGCLLLATLLLGPAGLAYADGLVPRAPGLFSAPAILGIHNNQPFISTTAAGAKAAHCTAWVLAPPGCAIGCEPAPGTGSPGQLYWYDLFYWTEYGACGTSIGGYAFMTGTQGISGGCPPHSLPIDDAVCKCEAGYGSTGSECWPVHTEYKFPREYCPAGGNPVLPMTSSKSQVETLGNWLGHQVSARYDTRGKVPGANGLDDLPPAPPTFGNLWDLNLLKSLAFQLDDLGVMRAVQARRGDWRVQSFVRGSTGAFSGPADSKDSLAKNSSGGWTYLDRGANSIETYDAGGRLLQIQYAGGAKLTYEYTSTNAPLVGLLYGIRDSFGRLLRFDYEVAGGAARIYRITDPAGNQVLVGYDAKGNLASILAAGNPARTLLYEDNGKPWALTGVIGEDGLRQSTYAYDDSGRALSTELPGGIDRFVLGYATPPGWSVVNTLDNQLRIIRREYNWQPAQSATMTLPNGQQTRYEFTSINGRVRVSGVSQPAGSGCGESASQQDHDTNGNVNWRNDFNGYRICYANNLSRNLESVRVEGLAADAACTVTTAGYVLPAGSRKVSTQWHPDWSLRVRVAEPGKITTYVYNGQPDPVAGGTASCAPSTARLPDNSPIAVLCHQVEQATTDVDGSQGFSAQLQTGVAAREQRWNYNQAGQTLTYDGPLPGEADTTRYEYYGSTSFTGTDPNAVGYTQGDLMKVTNPAGHVTTHTLYNRAGQVKESVDPNAVVTTYSYDAQRRLTGTSVGGQTTGYDYWPTGLLKQLTEPDGSWLFYQYDLAHRLILITDNLGNSLKYTLDNSGNRTEEEVRDSGATLRRAVSRSIDALGRVQQVTGRE